jgi:hypothetical protein
MFLRGQTMKLRITVPLAVLCLTGAVGDADDKMYLSCPKAKAELFPLVISAITEKWTIQNVSESLFMITATKEDKAGNLFGPRWRRKEPAVVMLFIRDGPDVGSLIDIKATNDRSEDAQENLLEYLPDGECVAYKPPKNKKKK